MDRNGSANGVSPAHQIDGYAVSQEKGWNGAANITELSVCASPSDVMAKSSKRRKQQKEGVDSLGAMLRKGLVNHQLGLSVNLMLFAGFTYALFPSLRERVSAFFALSYPSETQSGMYGPGARDFYLVGGFIVFFTALRAFALDFLLMPLAGSCGIAKRKGRVRFAEQSYMMIYYIIYWAWGLLLFVHDTPADVKNLEGLLISLWRDYPRLDLNAGMKLYYLSQLAFWIQQIVVIHIEERRKDHMQMLTHHIITVVLIAGSYPYRQWRVGNAVLVCMDLVDFIFPLAKVLKYLGLQTACDAAFGLFVIFWFLSRHVAYNTICWSIYAHVHETTMKYGIYDTRTGAKIADHGGENIIDNLFQPILHPGAQTVSFNANIRWLFLGLLGALQCITIAWFLMICGVVMRVLRGQAGADDPRSGDEEEEETGVPATPSSEKPSASATTDITAQPSDYAVSELPRFIEVESTSEDVTFANRPHKTTAKRKSKVGGGLSSGLNLGEHKEILNRIGCLSEEQLAREREKRGESGSPRSASAAGSARK